MTKAQAILELENMVKILKQRKIKHEYQKGDDTIYFPGYASKGPYHPSPCLEVCNIEGNYEIHLKVYHDDTTRDWGKRDLNYVRRIKSFDLHLAHS